MTNPTNNGGTAFPTQVQITKNGDVCAYASDGMSLRNYFAAHAMQGILSQGAHIRVDQIVNDSYMIADAMLKKIKNEPFD